jgi:secreted trypsin-like serine protease
MLLTHGYRAQSETPVYMQVGIVSHGPYECSAQGVPTIFTRVSAYAEWILDTIHD